MYEQIRQKHIITIVGPVKSAELAGMNLTPYSKVHSMNHCAFLALSAL